MSKKKTEKTETQSPPEESVEQPQTTESSAEEEGTSEPSLEEQLGDMQAQSQKNYDLYLRAVADLENYRKRAQREKEDLGRFANEKLLREVLPIKDNLERAVDHARAQESDANALLEGVEMTLGILSKTLEQFGVTAIESIGEPFDPAKHEAMGQMESEEHPPNTVVQEMQKGYFLNDRLLRPALVMIAKESVPKATDED